MKQTQRLLTMIFWGNLAICVVIALLFETSTVKKEMLKDDVQLLFIVATVMQLFTLGIIPLALRLFKFKTVRTELTTGTEDERATALRKWGLWRLDMLHLPMLLNLLIYYLTGVDGFVYMAIILGLSLFFVYPSMQRCITETATPDE